MGRRWTHTNCTQDAHCPMSSGTLSATRECEKLMFNIDTGICYLLSDQEDSLYSLSHKYWSGYLVCRDLTSIDGWASGVVSRQQHPRFTLVRPKA